MTELPPEAAALLERARREHNPTDLEAERVRRALHAKLGIAAALAPSAASAVLSSKAAAAASLGAQTMGGGQSGGFGAASLGSAASVGKTGTLLFGLKASKVLLAVVTLSGVASVPLMMRGDPRPRAGAAQCTNAPCPSADDATTAEAHGARLDPSVTPTPTSESLADRRGSDRRARRHEKRPRATQSERARDARVVRGEERGEQRDVDAPTPGDRGHDAPEPTIASRATTVSGATDAVNGAGASVSGASVAESGASARVVNAAPAHESDATAPAAPSVEASEAPDVGEPTPPPELALIRGALTSLRDGAPSRALTLLHQHGDAYPEGAFASERRGLRIVALCASGRLDEGRKERVVFLRREGSAPVAERVRHACQEAPGK